MHRVGGAPGQDLPDQERAKAEEEELEEKDALERLQHAFNKVAVQYDGVNQKRGRASDTSSKLGSPAKETSQDVEDSDSDDNKSGDRGCIWEGIEEGQFSQGKGQCRPDAHKTNELDTVVQTQQAGHCRANAD